MRDDLFRILQGMTERVRADAAAFDVDADDYLGWVWADVEAFGKRIGLFDRGGPPDEGVAQSDRLDAAVNAPTAVEEPDSQVRKSLSPTPHGDNEPAERTTQAEDAGADAIVARCFGCLLTLICGRQLSPA
jgi:hypothetical protein